MMTEPGRNTISPNRSRRASDAIPDNRREHHERSQLPTGEWVAGALILFDLGYYDFWLFDRIDANGGWFVSRVKANADFEIVEELRTWRGNSIPLEASRCRPSSTTCSDRKLTYRSRSRSTARACHRNVLNEGSRVWKLCPAAPQPCKA